MWTLSPPHLFNAASTSFNNAAAASYSELAFTKPSCANRSLVTVNALYASSNLVALSCTIISLSLKTFSFAGQKLKSLVFVPLRFSSSPAITRPRIEIKSTHTRTTASRRAHAYLLRYVVCVRVRLAHGRNFTLTSDDFIGVHRALLE